MTRVERLSVLAHELRSPVAALSALARAADDANDPELRGKLVVLGVAAGRDVERLLADPDLFSVRLRRVELEPALEAFRAPSVDVVVTGAPVVEADPTRLRQAVANLVSNGLRHGTRVEVRAGAAPDGVAIEVTDDGPGLDPSGDPFAKGWSGAGSTGYGLWLVRAIAEAHGGSVAIVPGDGARLRLVLPSAAGAVR